MRRTFTAICCLAAIIAIIAAAERFVPVRTCERCGAAMQPFRMGDPEWYGSPILECTECDSMIETFKARD